MITSLQISKKYNHDLTGWQHHANARWIDAVWDTLRPVGIWGYPAVGREFCKGTRRGQWHEVEDQLEVWVFMQALDSIGWRYGEYNSKATPV